MNNRGLILALFIIVVTAGIIVAVNYDSKTDSGRFVQMMMASGNG